MRILVLGAGGVGGYFGGRLAEKGEDVTFLVRKRRKQQIEKNGLVVHSVHGNLSLKPKLITASQAALPFDLILFSSKAYHLQEAVRDVKPFVGENTVVLPLLNGMAHIPSLIEAFGEEKIIGGLCFIETTLNHEGEIVQTSPVHRVVFGEFHQSQTERIQRIAHTLGGTKASFVVSDHIDQEMWHKYLFITALSGITTLMRAPVGPIRDTAEGRSLFRQLLLEAAKIMEMHGAPIHKNIVDEHMNTIEKLTYDMKSSMQRDMEKASSIEAEHIQGYLFNLARKYHIDTPLLNVIFQNLNVYERMLTNNSLQ